MSNTLKEYERIEEAWRLTGGESGTRLENFSTGYKAGVEAEQARSAKLIDVLMSVNRNKSLAWDIVDQAIAEYEAGE